MRGRASAAAFLGIGFTADFGKQGRSRRIAGESIPLDRPAIPVIVTIYINSQIQVLVSNLKDEMEAVSTLGSPGER